MKIFFALIFSIICISVLAKNKENIFIDSTIKELDKKEAILILVGLGSKVQGTKKIAEYFHDKGYDVFIPNYISRKSISKCINKLDNYISHHKLMEYNKLHVFSYILGSWTLNNWITNHPENNIATIIYDRSPLQERVPLALIKDIPLIATIVIGKIIKEFSQTAYPTLLSNKIHIGILIENKPTKLFLKHKKTALSLGPIIWDVKNLNQSYTDLVYLKLNHDEMYHRFDVFGEEIFYFIQHSKFTYKAIRKPYNEDSLLINTILK